MPFDAGATEGAQSMLSFTKLNAAVLAPKHFNLSLKL
jgi:hypothetical protein